MLNENHNTSVICNEITCKNNSWNSARSKHVKAAGCYHVTPFCNLKHLKINPGGKCSGFALTDEAAKKRGLENMRKTMDELLPEHPRNLEEWRKQDETEKKKGLENIGLISRDLILVMKGIGKTFREMLADFKAFEKNMETVNRWHNESAAKIQNEKIDTAKYSTAKYSWGEIIKAWGEAFGDYKNLFKLEDKLIERKQEP